MSLNPVLLIGGSGVVGRQTAKWFRERHPQVPLLIGGRNLQTAREVAHKVGAAQAIAIDLDKPGLGLEGDVQVSAVVMLAPDEALNGLAYAQNQHVPYLSIVNGLVEVGPELALFAHRATAAPVILASHWMAGAAMFLALKAVSNFDITHSIRLGAIIDENDLAGPAALEDMARVHDTAPAALAFEKGRRVWLSGEAVNGTVQAIDGRSLAAKAFSTFDTASLYSATGVPNIRFDLVTDASSRRLKGGEPAAEIVVEVEGEIGGRAQRLRATLEFKEGLASLTGLCVALSLSCALGLNDRSPSTPGLYLPEMLWETEAFIDVLIRSGVEVTEVAP